jgi:hypothetical protein
VVLLIGDVWLLFWLDAKIYEFLNILPAEPSNASGLALRSGPLSSQGGVMRPFRLHPVTGCVLEIAYCRNNKRGKPSED